MIDNCTLEKILHINFPVFEGEEPDDGSLETYEEIDFEDRRDRRQNEEQA